MNNPLIKHGDIVLRAINLTHCFGGVIANQQVSLALKHGHIHALLGPNGAGKSTFINLLSGELTAQEGRITLHGQDITKTNTTDRSQLGIGRSYQRNTIFTPLSVLDNLRLGLLSRQQKFSWQTPWRFIRALFHNTFEFEIDELLEKVGLEKQRHRIAATLSHGEQRQLEIALALATRSTILLLDEPLSGMGHDESNNMIALLNRLRPHHAMLLVEHDMDAVFALADEISVLVDGKMVASGRPDDIKKSAVVRQAYLGEDD